MQQNNELFFTIWYGVYDIEHRVLIFASGGHHAALLLPPAPLRPVPLVTRNPSSAWCPIRASPPRGSRFRPAARCICSATACSKSLIARASNGGMEHVLALLPGASGPGGPRLLYEQVRAAARPGPLEDDFSVLLLRFP